MSRVRIDLIEDEAGFLGLKPEWDRLLELAGEEASVFMGYGWYRCWWRHFGSGARLHLLVARLEGETVGIAPLQWRRSSLRGLPVRAISFLENKNSLHNDFLVLPGVREEVLRGMLDALYGSRGSWDMLRLNNIPADKANFPLLERLFAEKRRPCQVRQTLASPYLEVASGWEEFLAGRSSRVRKTLRNIRNTLMRAGSCQVAEVTTLEGYLGVRREVLEVARSSWTERLGDSLATPVNSAFFDDLTEEAAANGWLSLWILRLDGRAVAFEYHLRGCGKQHALRASFDEKFAHLSPGAYLEMQVLKNVFDGGDGVNRFDFGGSSDPYKKRWSDRSRPLFSFDAFHGAPYSRLCALLETRAVRFARGVRDRLRKNE